MSKPNDRRIDCYIGARLRQRRAALGLSQQRVADLLGLTFQQVQKYEKGTNSIRPYLLLTLASKLQVPVEWFYPEQQEGVAAPVDHAAVAFVSSRQGQRLMRVWSALPGPVRDALLTLAEHQAGAGQQPAVVPQQDAA